MRRERILPLIAAFWFFATINSFFTWNSYKYLFHVIPSFFVVLLSLPLITNKQQYNRKPNLVIFPVLLLMFWIIFTKHQNFWGTIVTIFDFLPFYFFVFWPFSYIEKFYNNIRKVFVFYSVGCPIITILSFLGVLNALPHFVLPGQELIHVDKGLNYNVYGVFAVLNNHESPVRCCGMALEPGHFSIYLGCIYMIDRIIGRKPNILFILGALSAFSATFFIIMIFTEVITALFSKRISIISLIKKLATITLIAMVIYSIIPKTYKEDIEFLFYGRNLETVLTAYNDNGSLTSALDVRASEEGISDFDNLSNYEFFVGGVNSENMLSDYRGMIVRIGLIGIIISFFCVITIIKHTDNRVKLILMCLYFLIIIHRSWMIPTAYLYTILFFASTLFSHSCNIINSMENKGNG